MLFDIPHKQILVHMRHADIIGGNGNMNGYFENKLWTLELPKDFTEKQIKSRATDMTWDELWLNRAKEEENIAKLDHEIATHQAAVNLGGAPPHFPDHIRQLLSQRKTSEGQIHGIDAELNMRPAFAAGCLCFVLVGCPVGIWFSKSDYLSAFITCFLPIVVIYYPLMLCTINMAKSGKIDAALGIWLADGLMAVAAGGLFVKLARN